MNKTIDFHSLFNELNLPREVRDILVGTCNIRYTQELLGYLATSGVISPKKLNEINELLVAEISNIPEETKSKLKVDDAFVHIRSYVLGQVLGKFVTSLPQDQQSKLNSQIEALLYKLEQADNG